MSVLWKNGVVRKGEVFYNGEWHIVRFSEWIKAGYKVVDDLSKELFGIEIIITSGMEGEHSINSKHPKGDAVDIRTWYYKKGEAAKLVKAVKAKIDKNYDIILESDHIHLEYDPK